MLALPEPLGKFFGDRGPHLAAMIAYFALLSFVPLLFLTVSLLGLGALTSLKKGSPPVPEQAIREARLTTEALKSDGNP